MSNYISNIENDYNQDKISLKEVMELKEGYFKLSDEEKLKLDEKPFIDTTKIQSPKENSSKFIRKLYDLKILGIISDLRYGKELNNYYKLNDDDKKLFDNNAELYLNNGIEEVYKKNIESIKKNVQFFTWLTIVSLVILVLKAIIENGSW